MTRLITPKTYKVYLNGAFARSESGRHQAVDLKNGKINVPLCSRKDVRNAVQGANKAQGAWAKKTGFNRGQILYRVAEMMEGRKTQFIDELTQLGKTSDQAELEVNMCIDRCIYYAGWCDKFQAISGTVNPVSSSHFNFTIPEAQGLIGIVQAGKNSLVDFISLVLPALTGGNAAVVLVPAETSTPILTFAEVLHTSDVPGGVIQILSGDLNEMSIPLAGHMDVHGMLLYGEISNLQEIESEAAENLKRVTKLNLDFLKQEAQGIKFITQLQEFKTTWHPIDQSTSSASAY